MMRTSTLTVAVTLLTLLAVTYLTIGPRVVPGNALSGDKVQHALGFGAILLPAAILKPRWLRSLAPAVAIFGGIVELVQIQVGRDGELTDWAADIIGIALAVGIGCVLRSIMLKYKGRRSLAPHARRLGPVPDEP